MKSWKNVFSSLSAFKNHFFIVFIPAVVSLVIASIFYPGGMSYDTLHALRSARNGVVDSMWPPMVSYVWRAVDIVSNDPSAMHFLQILLLLISFFSIVYLWTKKITTATLALVLYVHIPVILGTLAVIWKDVLMSSFLLASFLSLLLLKKTVSLRGFFCFSSFFVLLLFLGVSSRHNALAGALPLILYFAFIVTSRVAKVRSRVYAGIVTILLGFGLVVGIYSAKTFLDNYSLPSFAKMENQTKTFIAYTRVFDVAGASLCVGENLFDKIAPNITLEEIRSNFEPKHVNLSAGIIKLVGIERINEIWLETGFNHPICIFNYKFELMKYLLGMNSGDQFIITHPAIDSNEFGYVFKDSKIRNSVITYIVEASRKTIVRPWFLYLVSFFAFFYLLIKKRMTLDYFTLFFSGIGYLASLLLFGNAGDARLPFYSTTVFFIFLASVLFPGIQNLIFLQSRKIRSRILKIYGGLMDSRQLPLKDNVSTKKDGRINVDSSWTPMGVTGQFLENAETYHARYNYNERWKHFMGQALGLADIKTDAKLKVLDIGSGSGGTVFAAADLLGSSIIYASDISPQLLKILVSIEEKVPQLKDRIEAYCFDLHKDFFADEIFDLIVGGSILHHMLDPKAALTNAAKWLRPGGKVILFEPLEIGGHIMASIYLTLLAELESEADPTLINHFKAICHDYEARFGVPRVKPWTSFLDDKWLFHPSYLKEMGAEIGLKFQLIAPIYVNLRTMFKDSIRITLDCAGLNDVPTPDKMWSIIEKFDLGVSDEIKKQYTSEGIIIFGK